MVKPVTQMLDTRSLACKQSKYEAEDDVIVKADLGSHNLYAIAIDPE